MPHESVLDSLASKTFTPFVPDWDESDPDIWQSTYFGAQQGPRLPPDWVITEAAAHQIERGILKIGMEADVHLLERRRDDRRNLLAAKCYRSEVHRHFRDDSRRRQARRTGNRQTDLAMAERTTVGRVFRVRGMGGQRVRRPGRLWSGVSVPPSEALGPFALPDLSDGPGAPWSETTLAVLDVETRRIVDEVVASAAGLVLGNCGVIDAMVATLVDVESLEGEALDRFPAAVAQPERPPMILVAS